ncbi:glycosyltransferase family 2 protein [Rossellomorea marisflavi]|uniref:glycosyltransferase family 2 protein n=1 Tax=Rossellomorea marisflavi TaxID=189381 RepID=UPI001652CA48|nr:glycosyltransferase family 2 protein [Rossellomorea marisflavi]
MLKPLVSVIIPTYKRSDTLSRAIDSVLNQSYKEIEIIVVDDNNANDTYRRKTEQLMLNYNNHRNLYYLKHSENKNGAAARNTGINIAKGKYIAFLDDDDEFLSDKIENQVSAMENLDNSYGACYTGYKKLKANGKYEYGDETRQGNLLVETLMRSLFIYGGSNLMVKSKVIKKIKGFDESFTRNQDLELLAKIAKVSKIAYVNSCSLIMHYDSRVTTFSPEHMDNIDKLYLSKFNKFILNLNKSDQKRVFKMIELDRFRLLVVNKRFFEAIKYCISKKINPILITKYIYYIIHRLVTNKCYGFSIK